MSRQDIFTIGVEEEFQIIDPRTYTLSPDAETILALARQTLGDAVQPELILSQIEVATPICQTLADVRAELSRLRKALIEAAAEIGKGIAAAGTHPFSTWQEQIITPKARYQDLAKDYGRLIKEQVIFGCHVHVGLKDRETALTVMNRTRVWLPLLLALSANSPFWESENTGYASFRTGLWWSSPLSGPPPLFSSRAEHDKFVRSLVATKSIEDISRIYWDIRLPERFETIEFRVMDVCMTIDEATMLAGLVRALVRTCYEQTLRGEPVPEVRTELLRVANWRAARFGIEHDLVDVVGERVIPAREMLDQFLDFVRPALEAEGDWAEVSRLASTIQQQGNGAKRQRDIFTRTGNLEKVVEYVLSETARDIKDLQRV